MTEPLESLTGIAWSQLQGAYGPADAVPGLLCDVACCDCLTGAAVKTAW